MKKILYSKLINIISSKIHIKINKTMPNELHTKYKKVVSNELHIKTMNIKTVELHNNRIKRLRIIPIISILIFGSMFSKQEVSFAELNDNTSSPQLEILRVGDDINYPPYSFLDEDGNAQGFSIDLIKAAGRVMGYEVEYNLNNWDQVRHDLENKEIDVISGMFYTKERELIYSFTTPHSIGLGDIFSSDSSRIDTIEALRGKKVVVQKSDIIHEYLAGKNLDIEFIEVDTVSNALNMIHDGQASYAALLKPTAHYIIDENNIKGVVASGLRLAPQKYCMAVNIDDTELVHILNGGLQVLKSTGEYQEIYDRWLGIYDPMTFGDIVKKYSWVIALAMSVISVLFVMVLLLRLLVAKKTKALKSANEELIEHKSELTHKNKELTEVNEENVASLEEIIAIEEELRSHYERLLTSEEELRHSESRAKAVIDAIPDILFILDPQGVVIECHANGRTRLKEDESIFVGKGILEILPADSRLEGKAVFEATCHEDVVRSFEYEERIDDEIRFFEIRFSKSLEGEIVGIVRDITDDHTYKQRIEFLSYHDQLTSLYNRRYFEEVLLQLDNYSNLPFTLIMADVNGLKLVNDSFGHTVGDQLLKRMAHVLKSVCGKDYDISRIGGDEFVIMMPTKNNNDAEDLITKIQEASAKEMIEGVALSISYGWATKTQPEEHILDILNKAEDFMYKRKLFEGPSMRSKTIDAIIQTLHEKNQREEEHSQRVSKYCQSLGEALGLNEKDIKELASVGLLHDIGKIAIPEYLLNKPGKLTPEEITELRKHPEIGYRILSSVNDMSDLSTYILYHHERWDGNGYPRGLVGEDIPIQSRIITIADSFDAMTSERSYKKPMSTLEAVKELLANSGSQFDPEMTKVFVEKVLGTEEEVYALEEVT